MNKVSREEVYKAIDSEREYQNNKWGDLDTRNSVGDFIAYMQRYLTEAMNSVNPDRPEVSLANIRKVTALGVGAMETHGAPLRRELR